MTEGETSEFNQALGISNVYWISSSSEQILSWLLSDY